MTTITKKQFANAAKNIHREAVIAEVCKCVNAVLVAYADAEDSEFISVVESFNGVIETLVNNFADEPETKDKQ